MHEQQGWDTDEGQKGTGALKVPLGRNPVLEVVNKNKILISLGVKCSIRREETLQTVHPSGSSEHNSTQMEGLRFCRVQHKETSPVLTADYQPESFRDLFAFAH